MPRPSIVGDFTLDETAQTHQNTGRSHIWMVLRAGVAVLAVVVIIYSVQYDDRLVGQKRVLTHVVRSGDMFDAKDSDGTAIRLGIATEPQTDQPTYELLDATGKKYRYTYQPGAVTLAKNVAVTPAVWSLIVFAVVPILAAWRWRILLKVQGIVMPFSMSVKLTYAGLLMSFFLIGTTSGDLLKAYWTGRYNQRRTAAFVSVFVDRFIGFAVVIILAAVLLAVLWHQLDLAWLVWPIGLLFGVLVVGVTVLFSSRLRRWIRFDRWSVRLPFHSLLTKIDEALLTYRHGWRAVVPAVGLTAVLQLLASSSVYFLGQALQVNAPIWYFWFYVPLAFLMGSIPISLFWGLGLLEMGYVMLFAGSGLASGTQAAMLAMGARLVQLFWALPGAYAMIRGLKGASRDD